MAISPSIQEFLRQSDVEYTVFPHARAYTAAQEAAYSAVPERNWAKVVQCFADGRPVQAVVPADCDLDLRRLGRLLNVEHLRLATENELDALFPDCETGAMPPFGPLYGQQVIIDERLTEDRYIVFDGGTHANAIQMRYVDFARLMHPTVGWFGRRPQLD